MAQKYVYFSTWYLASEVAVDGVDVHLSLLKIHLKSNVSLLPLASFKLFIELE